MKTISLAKKCIWMLCTACILSCFSSCKDSSEDYSNVPGAQSYSWSANEIADANGEVKNYNFFAHTNWRASSNASWCVLKPTEGSKGSAQFAIEVQPNESGATRSAEIKITFEGYKEISFTIEQHELNRMSYNILMDEYLAYAYLWNDEYKSMKRDLTIPYTDDYDNYMRNTLMSMNTNTFDKKVRNGETSLYSFISRTEINSRKVNLPSRGVTHGMEKDPQVNGYGFTNFALVQFTSGELGFVVQGLYNDSPASTLGLKRGDIIYKVDGAFISESNYQHLYVSLMYVSSSAVKLTYLRGDNTAEITLTAMDYYENPVLLATVLEEDGHRIGYLNYCSFIAGYDNELLDAIAKLKSEGITDLVLDLRYNGGGHVISCMMLSACIAGDACKAQKFDYNRYNDERMKSWEETQKYTGTIYDHEAKMFYKNFMYPTYYGVNLNEYALGLNHVYVLVGNSTASASEALILSLKGIDFPVTMIGDKTHGKNVGMEVVVFEDEGYEYEMAPISYQFYNAKKESFSPDGMNVDYEASDWNNGYVEFGNKDDLLLGKAIELITGNTSSRSANQIESVPYALNKQLELPVIKNRCEGYLELPRRVK